MGEKNRFLKPVSQILGGVHLDHRKNSKDCATVRIEADNVTIPMSQHIGAANEPTVKKGDHVYVGTVVGDSDRFVSAPVHSSVSGTVTDVCEMTSAVGAKIQCVKVESDGLNEAEPTITPPVITDNESLCSAVRASGLVGLGGAGFPTHVKLKLSPDKPIDTLVINGAECEPYITADYRECIENTADIIKGILTLDKVIDFQNIVIAIEDNKPAAMTALQDELDRFDNLRAKVKVMALKSKYPQGAEKVIIYSATGRKLPLGKLPADVGCIVMNITSVGFLGHFFEAGMPLVSKRITLDGGCFKEPMNVEVPIGISVDEAVAKCGGFTEEPIKLLFGGPMMGFAFFDTSLPILKQNNAILAFSEKEYKKEKMYPCIRCGRCQAACPMRLSPFKIADGVTKKDSEELVKLNTMYCIECGSCAYSCPSKRPLVQTMRNAKAIVKNK